jgi:predicted alpha/beta-hydrolase family hydrolase
MEQWARRLSTLGEVQLFDYSYALEGRRRPDPLPVLMAAHRRALIAAPKPEQAVFLAGKSLGGRIGCHVSLEEKVNGLVCFGYPLCGGGDREKMRDEVLRQLTTPILFVQGTRDPLCPLDLLEQVRTKMTVRSRLHVVESGDHSLRVLKRSGQTQEEVDERIFEAIKQFVQENGAS